MKSTSRTKLEVRIGDHEFMQQGREEVVNDNFLKFLAAISAWDREKHASNQAADHADGTKQ